MFYLIQKPTQKAPVTALFVLLDCSLDVLPHNTYATISIKDTDGSTNGPHATIYLIHNHAINY